MLCRGQHWPAAPSAHRIRSCKLSTIPQQRLSAAAPHTSVRRQPGSVSTGAWFAQRQTERSEQRPTDSWELEPDDWDRLDGDYDEQELINAIYEEDGSVDALTQSIFAIAVTILLASVFGGVLIKIALVAWTLVGAAIRYSVVALTLIAVALFLI